ncbi:phosphoribosyl-AMP cyclohydrolase [Andreprevotia lacus DSM 23236]|jgi:phosphoribosyl-AMP cyclohydrolase|uniref:Phosphoribosyl-AMP cyclohydrolase n=1 Tax=Andreprevotia lacus DSM 23236 TaxID=1121001 RepID=A0A1W1XT71_9NEIS|nr:phosphoribosyl-AMP cyclohydrolase [Andreprevotia lacus]SMC27052.1 phosphoribosyl-AMP cyclohydrolase [Andreprevotia lacus DSM 23236]
MSWLDDILWDDKGLVPVIAQDKDSGRVLMFAYANRDAVALTAEKGTAHYWTRSRQKLWHKGEESGHYQRVQEIRLDCDGDVLIYLIEQEGGIACHTGRQSCFFRVLKDGEWETVDPVLKDPSAIYHKH